MMHRIVCGYYWLLLFLLPLKFGNPFQTGETVVFPMDWFEWLLTGWPPFLLPPLSGLALALALVVASPVLSLKRRAALAVGLWLALLLLSLTGLWATTAWDFALRCLWHLLGIVCLAAAGLILTRQAPAWRNRFLAAVALGGLWVIVSGWNQVPGGGLQRSLEMAEEMARVGGDELAEGIRSRLARGRAFGTFVYPNSYAAHLLLIGPLLLFWLGKLGAGPGAGWLREEPTLARFFRPRRQLAWWTGTLFFAVPGLILWAGALWFSGSRAAMVALPMALVGALLLCLPSRRLAVVLALTVLLLGGGALALRQREHHRGLASLEARVDYWTAALEMIRQRPLTGVGMGEFFHHYMRLKAEEMEVTRVPHNGFLFFAAQAGLPAGAAFLMLGLLPWWILRTSPPGGDRSENKTVATVERREKLLRFCVGAGCLAWFLHSLTDFNVTIPGTVSVAAVLPVLILSGDHSSRSTAPSDVEQRYYRPGKQARMLAGLLAAMAIFGIWRWPGERLYYNLTMTMVNRRNLPQFAEKVERAAGLSPFSPHPWQLLGHRAQALQAPAMAAAAYRRAAARSPHWAAMWFGVARNELVLGNRSEAATALQRGLQWYPEEEMAKELREQLAGDEE